MLLAVVDDLMFVVKINDMAKRAGLTAKFVKSEFDALELARELPAVIIIDLNGHSVDPIALIEKLKASDETRAVNTVAYVSHVQAELKQKAQEAGCDMVLARSAFSTNLPMILKRSSVARV